jgi:AcrR family transcriptional regulator
MSATATPTLSEQAFELAARLPRGPHNLGRDEVATSQRERLLAALTELLGTQGYGGVTIGAVCKLAGVSRATFYELFADKEECLIEAYARFARALVEAIFNAIGEDVSWDDWVSAAIDAYLDELERDPVAARAFLVELEAAGPAPRARRRDAMHGFAAAFAERHRAARAEDPALGPLPETAFLGLTLGVRELVRERLETEPEPKLSDLAPEIRTWVGAMVAGAAAASAT